ncbi:D-alanyl-D-alanine carboxypeptidase family protein [Methyloferula stellata]|uniref:D-alanyl-D-alanine carboxypeptidase family protein n=1 Tax=Methyloferula stellata TaxID=876270 RepID=UPI00036A8ED3|nr:D-alanyl-D-alanine carboxypeptidase family protein [Methyloferula stellata]
MKPWLLLLTLALASVPELTLAEALQTSVPSAILIDAETRTVLFEKNADEPETPASTAKVMTAELVFKEIAEGRLKLTDEFTISENAWRTGGAPSRGSSMFASLNSQVSIEDLIRGLVIDSGNDAAIALAEGVAGSEGAFATLMNRRAQELNLPHLVFTNAWGRGDPEQKVTAREMALLADHVIETYPDLYKYFGEKEFLWNKIKQPNRNPLLALNIGADGLKTGNIDNSGYGLVGSAVENGQRLIVAIYGAKNAKERSEEARKILLWGFRSFEPKTIFAKGETVGYARVFGGTSEDVPLISETPIRVLLPRESSERLTGKIVYTGPLVAPVEADKEVARLKISRGASVILDVPLRTAESVTQGSLPHRAMDAGWEYATILFRHYVEKK